jgi:putative flippase GtrA
MRLELAWTGEALRFGIVGTVGFAANAVAIYAVYGLVGIYVAGLIGWLAAATVTWLLNRIWTFRRRGRNVPAYQQWPRFLAVTTIGFSLYYGTYASLVSHSLFFATWPIVASMVGAFVGLAANFTLSRRFVFS